MRNIKLINFILFSLKFKIQFKLIDNRLKNSIRSFMFLIFMLINCVLYSENLSNLNTSLNIVGRIKYGDSLSNTAIAIMQNFKNKVNLNFVSLTPKIDIEMLYNCVKDTKINAFQEKISDFSLLVDPISLSNISMIPKSKINIAYSIFETSKIPDFWVEAINNNFDFVIVPDSFLVKAYENSGVKVPIFCLPYNIEEMFNDFFQCDLKTKKNTPFVFGCSASLVEHKNHKLLINAFINKYKNNKNVKLKLHIKINADQELLIELNNILEKNKINNIDIKFGCLDDKEYLNFFKSLDCYVLLSKGEGFSLTPREALALGIPCILSNNTAHKTLVKCPGVILVKSEIIEKAKYITGLNCDYGNVFNCEISDVEKALEYAYNNYERLLKKASRARNWIKQHNGKNLKQKYLNLINPSKIILGDKNEIANNYLMTTSKELYEKYLNLNKN